jgi:hypothetical protein
VDERFYHPTGAESYYGRKKKFKGFLHFFYKVTGESREPPVKSESNAPGGLTALHQEYETLWSLEVEAAVGCGLDHGSGIRGSSLDFRARNRARNGSIGRARMVRRCGYALLLTLAAAVPLAGRGKSKLSYGEGLIVSVPLPAREVEQVVGDVAQNGVIRGTKEYNKDEFVSGAKAATSSHVFPPWTEGGKVFYKVREQALDPRNFKDSSDSGTLVVRYVVQAQGEKNTVLRINALFKEDYRHVVHQSNGSVETAEYNDIREHVEAIELMKKQNVEAAEQQRQERLAKKQSLAKQADGGAWPMPQSDPPPSTSKPVVQATETQEDAAPGSAAMPSSDLGESPSEALSSQSLPSQAQSSQVPPSQVPPSQAPSSQAPSSQGVPVQTLSGQSLEDRVRDLRKQVARVVKAPGAPLKSAPFHTASTLQSLPPGTEVLILISTPYWYGIETHEGQHGWIMRDELEQP